MTTTLKPVIALIPEEVETLLIPIVDQIAASIRTGCDGDFAALITLRAHGECGVTITEGPR